MLHFLFLLGSSKGESQGFTSLLTKTLLSKGRFESLHPHSEGCPHAMSLLLLGASAHGVPELFDIIFKILKLLSYKQSYLIFQSF